MQKNINNITEKINFKEKLGYFKKLLWLFLLILVVANIAFFYFVDGVLYFLTLIMGNVLLFWLLIPIFIWIGKTYLLEAGVEIMDTAKAEFTEIGKERIVKVVKKDEE